MSLYLPSHWSVRTRLALLAVVVALTTLGLAAPASAILWRVSKSHVVSYAGIVGKSHPTNVTHPSPPGSASNFDAINGNLDYSGGPVMPSSTNVVVVWKPTTYSQNFDEGVNEGCGAANSQGQFQQCLGYEAGVAQFFTDLAAASGQATNSDSVGTQYNDAFGHQSAGGPSPGHYSATYGGLLTDTDAYPANSCPGAPQNGVCLTDAEIQAELQKFLHQNGQPAGSLTHEYYLITPPGVASCLGRNSQGVWQCAGNAVPSNSVHQAFCAYHGTTATAGHYIYANIPDLSLVGGCDPFSSSSPSGNSPDDCSFENCIWNQSTAEGVTSAISHEHNESVTDPQPNNAWTDWGSQVGGENGDKCNNDGLDDGNLNPDRSNGNDGFTNDFRPQVTPYNEIINGRFYLIQQEWSNDGQQCLDHWSLPQGEIFPAPTFVVSHRNGNVVTLNAGASCTGNAACPSGSLYVWQFNDDVAPGDTPQLPTVESSSPSISHKFPRPGVYRVALTVMGPTGLSRGAAEAVRVYARPVVRIAASTRRLAHAPISFSSAGTTHAPGLTIKSYLWKFGDGATSTAANPTHTYANPGTFTVRLTVTDSAGQAGTAAGPLKVAASCRVPNVAGKTLSPAESAIKAAGCAVGHVTKPSKRRKNAVLVVHSQSPAARTIVARGTPVSLTMVWKAR
ncbi:MAG: PKD domain-containing protein [Solirubrobacteraceae bacterium]